MIDSKLSPNDRQIRSSDHIGDTNKMGITPPPELVRQWIAEWMDEFDKRYHSDMYVAPHQAIIDIANQAAQWGADQELEACCKWPNTPITGFLGEELRAARRPKSPSLKEQALRMLDYLTATNDDKEVIRRALEQLPE